MSGKSERFELKLDSDVLLRIDEWRSGQRSLPSRSEAVRTLINAGLGKPEYMQQFQIARFNILYAAKTQTTKKFIPDAYAYAWQNKVFPFFNETAQIHEPFAQQFDVTKDIAHEFVTFLDKSWLEGTVPSFYQLEDRYDVRGRGIFWDRMKLINTCRYIFLSGKFDQELWSGLMTYHPSEARSITDDFSIDEIYLA